MISMYMMDNGQGSRESQRELNYEHFKIMTQLKNAEDCQK